MDELTFKGQRFISSKRASEITGYTKDYIGQLCRAEKIDARLVGRNWYVSESSLLAHKTRGASNTHAPRGEKSDGFMDEPARYIVGGTTESPYYKKDSGPLIPEPIKEAVASGKGEGEERKLSKNPDASEDITVKKAFISEIPPRSATVLKREVTQKLPTEQSKTRSGSLTPFFLPISTAVVCMVVLLALFTFEKVVQYESSGVGVSASASRVQYSGF